MLHAAVELQLNCI